MKRRSRRGGAVVVMRREGWPAFFTVVGLGISWCIDSQLQPEFIFSDCLNLVTKVNGDWQDLSALSGLVSQIRLLFSNFPEASLKYLPRQFNANAHCLAKDAIKSREEAHKELF
ncbi:hypothetical protein F8388_001543 [Cannabis sativa]|uniref:RNase H type-1 domain-containing protein n=1 Tax=Cannabis sativa TaxID=3483 RepID=A0A7J6E0F7_CANSA|nr:hypothetical protein G4B88_026351 [Cannabis sativa]KAF4395156.1 hypothetical protein F8388_001543 [Cannabis sativa]